MCNKQLADLSTKHTLPPTCTLPTDFYIVYVTAIKSGLCSIACKPRVFSTKQPRVLTAKNIALGEGGGGKLGLSLA